METRAKKIGSSVRHSIGIINGHVVRGGIRMRQQSAPGNPSCLALPNSHRKRLILEDSRALSRLVVVGGRHDPAQKHVRQPALPGGASNF